MSQVIPEDHVALFDMDGTMCDYDSAVLRDLKPLMAPEEKEITTVHTKHPPHIAERISLIRRKPGWWKKLEPHPLGFEIFRMCQSLGFMNALLTKGPTTTESAWTEKVAWRRCYLPGVPITITEDSTSESGVIYGKGRVYGKVLVDDYPEYLKAWVENRPRGLGIMPVNEGNKKFYHPRVIPAMKSNLDIIRIALKAVHSRKSGEPLKLPTEVIQWVHEYYMDQGVSITQAQA